MKPRPNCAHKTRFIRSNFTAAEKARRNPLYIAVKNGRFICKTCGKELNRGARK